MQTRFPFLASCPAPQPVPRGVALVLLLTAAGTLYLGLFPGKVMQLAIQSALSLR